MYLSTNFKDEISWRMLLEIITLFTSTIILPTLTLNEAYKILTITTDEKLLFQYSI